MTITQENSRRICTMFSKEYYKNIIEKGSANMQASNFVSASIDFYKALDFVFKDFSS